MVEVELELAIPKTYRTEILFDWLTTHCPVLLLHIIELILQLHGTHELPLVR